MPVLTIEPADFGEVVIMESDNIAVIDSEIMRTSTCDTLSCPSDMEFSDNNLVQPSSTDFGSDLSSSAFNTQTVIFHFLQYFQSIIIR